MYDFKMVEPRIFYINNNSEIVFIFSSNDINVINNFGIFFETFLCKHLNTYTFVVNFSENIFNHYPYKFIEVFNSIFK